MNNCLWCGKFLNNEIKTREHLIPKCLGGTNSSSNIRYACYDCNQERGMLTAEYHLYNQVRNGNYKGRSKKRKLLKVKMNQRFDRIISLQDKWIMLELSVLGYSPSKTMVFKKWKM